VGGCTCTEDADPARDPSCYKRGNTFLFRVRCVHISMTKFVQSSQLKNEVSQ
jgi:hypothetical protein